MTTFSPDLTPRLSRERRTAKLRNVDWSLVLFVGLLVPIGILSIYSATHNTVGYSLAARQTVFFAVGLAVMAVIASIDYRSFRDFLGLIYIATATALVLVLIIGREVDGTRGWFVIGGISLQPAEFAKIALILALSALFTGRTGSVDATRFTAGLTVLGGVSFLVLLEGETGSVFVYCCVAVGIFFMAGVPARLVLLLIASGAIAFSVIFSSGLLQDYQEARLTSFINDEGEGQRYGWNQRQSVTAVGAGGLTGAGYLEGPQTQFNFVPAQETDFIFTVVGEELGFVGGVVVLGLQALILIRILRAAQMARDGYGTLICMGVFLMFLTQIFQNVGMALRLMPITGIPLPFMSYGGSSLLTSCIAIGLVQSVVIHRHRGTPAE